MQSIMIQWLAQNRAKVLLVEQRFYEVAVGACNVYMYCMWVFISQCTKICENIISEISVNVWHPCVYIAGSRTCLCVCKK